MIGTVADPIGIAPQATHQPGILAVDDEPALLRLLQMALRPSGFTIWRARSGAEAVALYRDLFAHIDLVLLDVQMPDADGPQTLQALQQLNPEVRCCFMSGHTGQYDFDDLTGLGALQVFAKPFELGVMAATLRQLTLPRFAKTSGGKVKEMERMPRKCPYPY
jgi:two-component system, OmpR family, response regulator